MVFEEFLAKKAMEKKAQEMMSDKQKQDIKQREQEARREKLRNAMSYDVGKGVGRWTDKYVPTFKRAGVGAKTAVGAAGGFVAGRYSKAKESGFIEGSKGSLWWIVLATLLWYSDIMITRFDGLGIEDLVTAFSTPKAINFMWNAWILVPIALYLFLKRPDKRELVSFGFFVVVIYTVLSISGFSDAGAVLHVIFGVLALIFLFYYAIPDRAQAHVTVAAIIFADFFLFSLLADIPNMSAFNRVTVPIWILFSLFYTKESKIKSIILALVVVAYAILFIVETNAIGYLQTTGTQELTEGQIGEAKSAWQSVLDYFKGLRTDWQRQIAYATGDYYTGQVDEKAKEKLGVYIEKMKSADPVLYTDEPITIWATLKAQTLDKDHPIDIGVSCCYDKKDRDCKEENKGEAMPKEYIVYSKEEVELDCNFDEEAMPKGSHQVSFVANFSFTTMSYIKSYFMDEERKRAMVREEIDIFDFYKITDKEPTAIYTSGPVGIGMGVGRSLPIGVKEGFDENDIFTLSITLENVWEGEIKDVNELEIILPDEMEIVYDEGKETMCGGYKLFQGFDEGNIVYELDNSQGKKIDDVEMFHSIRCGVRIVVPDELREEPIITKYFKVSAGYDYELTKTISIDVKKPKTEEVT